MPDDPFGSGESGVSEDWAGRCLSRLSSMAGRGMPGQERRAAERYAASGAALIKPEFGLPVACTLVDRSEGGARLRVLSVLGIPDAFILSIGAERMRARVAWRSPNELGVALTPV